MDPDQLIPEIAQLLSHGACGQAARKIKQLRREIADDKSNAPTLGYYPEVEHALDDGLDKQWLPPMGLVEALTEVSSLAGQRLTQLEDNMAPRVWAQKRALDMVDDLTASLSEIEEKYQEQPLEDERNE